jgi:predicted dehydrogenase
MNRINIGIIGTTGYGSGHVRRLLEMEHNGLINFTCFADLRNERNLPQIEELTKLGKKHFENYKDMLDEDLDGVIICSPLHLHKEMTLACFDKRIAVYLEKPPVVLMEDMNELLESQSRNGVTCQVGFQHSACANVHHIIDTINSGVLGKPLKITAQGKWSRPDSYFQDSPWKGRLQVNGIPVLDGSVMNPLSHLLNISLFFADGLHAGNIQTVQAELYRGHSFIESEDTCCARIKFEDLTLCYYSTTCAGTSSVPYVQIQCEKGIVKWGYDSSYIRSDDGFLTGPAPTVGGNLVDNWVNHLLGGTKLYMPLEKSKAFVQAANGIFASSGKIQTVPEAYMTQTPNNQAIVAIEHMMEDAAKNQLLYSEIHVPWAVESSSIIHMDDFQFDWKSVR